MEKIENTPLAVALSCAVPLQIMLLEDRGGPDEGDFNRAKEFGDRLCGPDGADVIYRGKQSAEMFNGLSHAIAVLAFCPGGVKLFGQHFEGKRA